MANRRGIQADQARAAARAVLAEMEARRGIADALRELSADTRAELLTALAGRIARAVRAPHIPEGVARAIEAIEAPGESWCGDMCWRGCCDPGRPGCERR